MVSIQITFPTREKTVGQDSSLSACVFQYSLCLPSFFKTVFTFWWLFICWDVVCGLLWHSGRTGPAFVVVKAVNQLLICFYPRSIVFLDTFPPLGWLDNNMEGKKKWFRVSSSQSWIVNKRVVRKSIDFERNLGERMALSRNGHRRCNKRREGKRDLGTCQSWRGGPALACTLRMLSGLLWTPTGVTGDLGWQKGGRTTSSCFKSLFIKKKKEKWRMG